MSPSTMQAQPNGHTNAATRARPIFIFDIMRSRSCLFYRYLCTNPTVYPFFHPYLLANLLGPERCPQKIDPSPAVIAWDEGWEQIRSVENTFASETRELEAAVRAAEKEGKTALFNEHFVNLFPLDILQDVALKRKEHTIDTIPRNPTRIPDHIFDQLRPIILIRHPILSIQSNWTACSASTPWVPGDTVFTITCQLRYSRLLFDLFRAQGREIVVVDGEDLVWRTKELGDKLCEKLGFEQGSLKEEWEKLELSAHPIIREFTTTIFESEGIIRPEGKNGPDLDLDKAVKKWTGKWGSDIAVELKRLVNDNLPDYEYLKQFKI